MTCTYKFWNNNFFFFHSSIYLSSVFFFFFSATKQHLNICFVVNLQICVLVQCYTHFCSVGFSRSVNFLPYFCSACSHAAFYVKGAFTLKDGFNLTQLMGELGFIFYMAF